MSRFEKLALAFLILIAVALWTAVGWSAYQDAWKAPLGPVLALPSQTPALRPSAAFSSTQPGLVFNLAPGKATQTPYIEKAQLCGGPLPMMILAIGSDTRAKGYLYGLADVTRLVRVDFITPRVTVLEFPRDIWVEIPGISDHYGTTH
jgi:hypothetical protein